MQRNESNDSYADKPTGQLRHVSRVDSDADYDDLTPAEQRSVIRRVDRRLVATVGAMYCISLVDRTNMSAANIAGMSVELNLIGFRYVRLPGYSPDLSLTWLQSSSAPLIN